MGLRAAVIPDQACCGLTWITTGQLTAARRIVTRAVETPACVRRRRTPRSSGWSRAASPRSAEDAGQLVDDPRVAEVSAGVRSLAEFLADRVSRGEWTPPDLSGVEVVAQPHCHHHAGGRLGDRRRPARADRGQHHPGRWLLRARGQLRGRAGPLRGLGAGGRARPAARRTECGGGRRGPRRRLLLPHPARRPGRRRLHLASCCSGRFARTAEPERLGLAPRPGIIAPAARFPRTGETHAPGMEPPPRWS
jgi:hypothetical protein